MRHPMAVRDGLELPRVAWRHAGPIEVRTTGGEALVPEGHGRVEVTLGGGAVVIADGAA